MKKILLFLILCLSVSAQAVELDHFINPLFYQDLKTNSHGYEDVVTKITPNSILLEGVYSEGDCRLIDQSQTRLLYRCVRTQLNRYNYPVEIKSSKLYVLTEEDIEQKRCYVTLYYKDFEIMELDLDYDPQTNDATSSGYYIESDDCGITEATNPPQ